MGNRPQISMDSFIDMKYSFFVAIFSIVLGGTMLAMFTENLLFMLGVPFLAFGDYVLLEWYDVRFLKRYGEQFTLNSIRGIYCLMLLLGIVPATIFVSTRDPIELVFLTLITFAIITDRRFTYNLGTYLGSVVGLYHSKTGYHGG